MAEEAERDEAQALLDGLGAELQTVEEQLAPLQSQWDSDLAAWNDAGCPGDPPEAPRDYVTLQRARVVLREKLGANDRTLQAAEGIVQSSRERLAVLSLQRRSAHRRAAVEAVRERLDGPGVVRMIEWTNER